MILELALRKKTRNELGTCHYLLTIPFIIKYSWHFVLLIIWNSSCSLFSGWTKVFWVLLCKKYYCMKLENFSIIGRPNVPHSRHISMIVHCSLPRMYWKFVIEIYCGAAFYVTCSYDWLVYLWMLHSVNGGDFAIVVNMFILSNDRYSKGVLTWVDGSQKYKSCSFEWMNKNLKIQFERNRQFFVFRCNTWFFLWRKYSVIWALAGQMQRRWSME